MNFNLLVMPFISLALIKINNEKKEKSIVHKFNFSILKLIIIALIISLLAICIYFILKRI